jgi:tetratricopeptide (TPR) repeat protein
MTSHYYRRVLSLLVVLIINARASHGVKESLDSLLESLSTRMVHTAADDSHNYEFEGTVLFDKKQYKEAIELYKKAISQQENSPALWCKLGQAHFADGNHHEAIKSFTQALSLDPVYHNALAPLARAYERINDLARSEETWIRIIIHDSFNREALTEIGRLLCDQQRFDESLNYLEIIRSKHPDDTIILFQLANTLNTANKTEESLVIYEYLLTKHPNSSAITYNTAYTLKKLGRVLESLPLYEKTLQLDPEHVEAHFSRGLAYLAIGDFERGWEEYEWRWKRDTQRMNERRFSQPLWDGSDLNGKTILLHAEQGLGDTFQFIRFAKVAHDKGGIVIAAVQNPVVDILALCPYIDRVISLNTALPHFDVHAPLMSVPYILKINEATVPHEIPYLYAHAKLEKEWKEKIAHDRNFKVGICWQGNANYSTPFLRAVVAAKSIKLNQFEPLFNVPGVTIYNLQKVTGEEQLKDIPAAWNFVSFGDDFDNAHGRFMDTAALIKNLDLVISVDTGLAHIAAALGTEVWTFLPNPADWRWMLDRTDTPWYPNMTLFRQATCGDWNAVMHEIATRLEERIKQSQHKYQTTPLADILDILIRSTIKQGGNATEKRAKKIEALHNEVTRRSKTITDLSKIKELTMQLAQITSEMMLIIADVQKTAKSPLSTSYHAPLQRYAQLIEETIAHKKEIAQNTKDTTL